LADAIPRRFRALVLVAAYTGLRWGELAGLRVKRVDLLHRRITASCEPAGRSAWSLPIPCIRGSSPCSARHHEPHGTISGAAVP
jgi:site-specific recombinase XerC